MNEKEKQIEEKAIKYVKEKAKSIVTKFANIEVYKSREIPVSVFMAGSPGAGKTEFSKELIDILSKNKLKDAIRIDADEIREIFTDYVGGNAYLFQVAVSIAVDKIHDHILKNKQNFILDGTLANLEKAKSNICRSLKKNRRVFIFYIYQDPLIAWSFTKEREKKEGRRIPKEAFIKQFFASKKTVNKLS